ncbi:MAG: Hsp20/alpha crystallin family protein [Deltaproteobacteria bacterium]|nr:Hsp20/alpha crystallin family protein [Deltaproteobacteria bacterium]
MPQRRFGWDEDFHRLGERVDDFVDRVLGLAAAPRYGLQPSWRPSLDMYRVADGIAVIAELPGVDEANLQVTVDHDRLLIRGVRQPPRLGTAAEPLQLEIDSGPFERCIALPSGSDGDRVTAHFRQGLLTVHVPLREASAPVRVRVATPETDPPHE